MVRPGVGNAKADCATISPNGSAGRNPSTNERELIREMYTGVDRSSATLSTDVGRV